MSAWDDMVVVGRISRPHGLRGQVAINPQTDFVEERFVPGATMWTRTAAGEAQMTIATARVQGARPIVGFAGVATVEDAARLSGLELRIPEAMLRPLDPGTYYEHQLAGCLVETAGGERVGTVARVEGAAGSQRLVVDGPRGEIDVPLAGSICREVDVASRRIVIEPPPGLLELNEAGSRQRAAGRKKKPLSPA